MTALRMVSPRHAMTVPNGARLLKRAGLQSDWRLRGFIRNGNPAILKSPRNSGARACWRLRTEGPGAFGIEGSHAWLLSKGGATMIRSNFERWPKVPQPAIGSRTQMGRPARLARSSAARRSVRRWRCPRRPPAPTRKPAAASVGGSLSADEVSSRRHGAGSRRHHSGHKSAHHKAHKNPHHKASPWAAAAKKNRKELARLDKAMNRTSVVQKKRAERETRPWAASTERNRKELARRDKAMGGARHESPGPVPSPSPGPPPTPPR
jgi:hypothetical protein